MFVACGWLLFSEEEKRTEKFVLQRLWAKSLKSPCQEPLTGASSLFPDITPFVSGGELKGVQASEQKLKVRAKESDKSNVRKGRHQKRRLKDRFVRTVVGAVCLS